MNTVTRRRMVKSAIVKQVHELPKSNYRNIYEKLPKGLQLDQIDAINSILPKLIN